MSWCLQLTSWISLLGDQAALWTAGYAADSLVHKQQEVWEPRYSGCSRGHYGKCLYSMSISQMDSFLSAIFSTHIEFSGICDKNLVFCLLWSPNLLLLFLCVFLPRTVWLTQWIALSETSLAAALRSLSNGQSNKPPPSSKRRAPLTWSPCLSVSTAWLSTPMGSKDLVRP